jgi:hypothetical protein
MNRRFVPLLALPALLATTRSETAARLGGTPAEPVFDPSQSRMIFQQNFDRYTTDSIRPPCGTSPASTPKRVVDNSVQHCTPGAGWTHDANVSIGPGHSGNGVAIHYEGPYQETHGVVVTLGSSTGKAMTVVQYWAKFTADPGYSLTDGKAIIQIKNIMLWNDQTRFQWATHNHNSGCPFHAPAATTIGGIEWVDDGCDADQPVGPYFEKYADGQWHRWTVEYKPNTSTNAKASPTTSTRDGVARLWIDGALTNNLERSACGTTPPGGYKPWCDPVELDGLWGGNTGVLALQWGANRTDGSGIKFTMAIDDVRCWVAKS